MKLDASDPRLSERLAELFAAGGVAIMPCDTIYGIVGPAPASEARIRELKGRGEKSFLQLIAGADWLERFGRLTLPPTLAAYWPGPLTLIFPAGEGSVALRVPADSRLRLLLERLGRPLYSTSVNRSGQPALWRSAEILEQFETAVDLVVDAGDLPGRLPSTIVDISRRPFRVLRQGALELPPEALGD
jgi:L-threonylcarbamoyladenylate synthase